MSILADSELQLARATGELVVQPLSNPEQAIQPASIDLRLSGPFKLMLPSSKPVDTERLTPPGVERQPARWQTWRSPRLLLSPGAFCLASTVERITLGRTLAANVSGKSSLGRLGLMVHVTAGFIDPGFDGNITLELKNLSPCTLILHEGQYIAQLQVLLVAGRVNRPYGAERGSHYTGDAAKGTVLSR